jgi:hypothetical protein
MSFMLVSVAFLSFSAFQADQGQAGSGAGLSSENREAPQNADTGEGTDANGERRICRRITTSSTHQYRRVCLTARQWRDYDNEG